MISLFQQERLAKGLEERVRSSEVKHWGPCIATVTAVDPETGRVKLRFDTHGPSTTGEAVQSEWAPVALSLAGPGSGVCFLPDPADGVQALVVFLDGFFSMPIVVGFVPSKVDALPDEVRAGGSHAIVSQQGGPRVVLQKKTDQHDSAVVINDGKGNSFEIRSAENGIVITVAKGGSITLAAPEGTIAFDAATLTFNGTKKIQIKGGEIAATATGTHVIKGKTVEINC